MNDAKLAKTDVSGPRVGVALGSTVACMLNSVDFYSEIRNDGSPDLTPLLNYLNGDISERVAARLGADGPRITVANACSSGANAIAAAFSWLSSGLCDIVVAGGADELSLIPYCGFNSLQIMGDEPCSPFDGERRGLTLGEGAGIVILETEESLKRRGLKPKARLLACGLASDAYHLTGPHPEARGLKKAVSQALESAGVEPSMVDYVNAHGTATPDNDRIEGNALFEIFGQNLRYSSTKYYTGHTLAAAGAIEAAVCVAGLKEGRFPGTPVLNPDPDIPIAPLGEATDIASHLALSTSMAFGGTCVALLFEHPDSSTPDSPSATSRPGKEDRYSTLSISSLGVVGAFGRGVEALRSAMKNSGVQNSDSKTNFTVPPETFRNGIFKRLRRRADSISLMALAAAIDAIESANLAENEIQELSLVLATSFGSHTSTFKFLDSMLDYGQDAPSPTSFSNSVHNAPAFHITRELGIHGSSITTTAFRSPFAKALTHAESLIASGKAERVLLVVADETNETMKRISELWAAHHEKPEIVWGEGAVALLLEKTSDSASPLSELLKSSANLAETGERFFGRVLFNEAAALACAVAETSSM